VNGPSVLLHRSTAANQLNFKINNLQHIANITLSIRPFGSHIGCGINNVILMRMHKCDRMKYRLNFNAIEQKKN